MTDLAERSAQPADVEDTLRAFGKMVRNAMLDAMPDGEPLRWLYRPMREYPSRPGSALRPALCISAGRAFGADDEALLGIAVGTELLHNAFLVHDDIAGGGELRRGRPTLAARHGMAAALNAGDALAVVASRVVRRAAGRLDRDLGDRVMAEFDTMALRTLEGRCIEIGWQLDNVHDLAPEDYLELIMRKSCWYTTVYPLRVAALIGSRGEVALAPLVRFGFHLGAAVQIRDELRDLSGDEQAFGSRVLGDLRDGRRTLALVHLLVTARGADRELVREVSRCARAESSAKLLREVRSLLHENGSIAFAREYAEGILMVAQRSFDEAFVGAHPGPDLDFLRSLVPYIWARWC